MKKKLFSLLIILSLFTIIGCTDDKKENIVAPTIESVYQDVNGAVYLKCTTTHTSYSPDVYFGDSNTSHQTQRYDSDVLVLTYSESNNGFYYHSSNTTGDPVFDAGDTISIRIKEQETESTNESDYSNEVSYILKAPQSLDSESLLTDYKSLLYSNVTVTAGNSGTSPTPNSKYGIAYNATKNKYVFAENTYTNIAPTENGYTYIDNLIENSTIAQAYEYHILTQTEINENPSIYQLTDDFIDQLTFTPNCTDIVISDSLFVDEQTSTPSISSYVGTQLTNKVCYMVYRLKGTSTELHSRWSYITIYKVFNEYVISNNTNPAVDESAACSKAYLAEALNGFELVFNYNANETYSLTNDELKQIIKAYNRYYFGSTNQNVYDIEINGLTLVINDGNGVSNTDFDNTINVVIKLGNTVLKTISVTVKGPSI